MGKINVPNAMALNGLLMDKFGKRIQPDLFAGVCGEVVGVFDGKKYFMTFLPGSYLLASTEPGGRAQLEELKETLNFSMADQGPICSYDSLAEGKSEEEAIPTLEWDIDNPDERLRQLANGKGVDESTKIINLEILNGKQLSDYIETSKETEEKPVRIYGLDPGSITDLETVNNLSEPELYLQINALGGYIFYTQHAMYHGHIGERVDLTEEQYAIEYLVNLTRKFGVELPEPKAGQHMQRTPSYNKWFEFYHHHFEDVLTEEEWDAFKAALEKHEDVSKWLPKGRWNDDELADKPMQPGLKPKQTPEE